MSKVHRLWDIEHKLERIAEHLLTCSPEEIEAYLDELNTYELISDEEIEVTIMAMKNLIAAAEKKREAANYMVDQARLIERTAETAKGSILHYMKRKELRKWEGEHFSTTFSIRKNSKTVIDNEETIPADYQKISVTLDKTEIKKAILAGVNIEGAHLEDTEVLTIR